MTIGLSPKLITAILAAVLVDVLDQTVVTLPPLVLVIAHALLVGLAVYQAGPGAVTALTAGASDDGLTEEALAGIPAAT